MHIVFFSVLLIASSMPAQTRPAEPTQHSFTWYDRDFLLDGKPFLIRSGEMHAARVPREYWRHRLSMIRAMGCNTVCAYLFWNQHEPRPGEFDFAGEADAAEYCRIAHDVGLKVILRPGPYSCAEWDLGGFPWWLLKTPDIKLRTRDPRYLDAARRYLLRVGNELAPLQITRGGPIIMVQVENEYGSYGNDKEYIGQVRDALRDGGFDVPFFTCDGPSQLKNDVREDIFCVVNFGGDPEANFKALREIRPKGPLMCGEYYPGWFDSWGKPHHTGDPAKVVREFGYMLEHNQSFSIYMVHGGTSFGFWAGANSPPFSPQSTSYDYDAPIDEAGRATPKYHAIRELFAKHLLPGETLPEGPAPNPIISIRPIQFAECAPLFDNLGAARKDDRPRPMEMYDQAQGSILYRTTVAAGGAGTLTIVAPRDYVQVYLDGRRVGVLDRRYRQKSVDLPAREKPARLDILVEAMGRVNFGADIHDRKGITEKATLTTDGKSTDLTGWEIFSLPFDDAHLRRLEYKAATQVLGAPGAYRATFEIKQTGDTFLDMRGWSKGNVWVNGHNLGRYWNIGPQQTLYLPGCWLTKGHNEIVVLDITGEAKALTVEGLTSPILNDVNPDSNAPMRLRKAGQAINLTVIKPAFAGEFSSSRDWQTAKFEPMTARYVCIEALSSHNKDPFTTIAELALLDGEGKELPGSACRVVYADSEELSGDDGSAGNVLDGRDDTFWHTEWEAAKPAHPHQIVIDIGHEAKIGGLRYLARQDSANGRVKEYRVYLSVATLPGL